MKRQDANNSSARAKYGHLPIRQEQLIFLDTKCEIRNHASNANARDRFTLWAQHKGGPQGRMRNNQISRPIKRQPIRPAGTVKTGEPPDFGGATAFASKGNRQIELSRVMATNSTSSSAESTSPFGLGPL